MSDPRRIDMVRFKIVRENPEKYLEPDLLIQLRILVPLLVSVGMMFQPRVIKEVVPKDPYPKFGEV